MCITHIEWEAMLINLRVECLHNFFEILLHGTFLGLFLFQDVIYLFERERGEKNHERVGQMEKDKQVPC